jgi:hypothetical protein
MSIRAERVIIAIEIAALALIVGVRVVLPVLSWVRELLA